MPDSFRMDFLRNDFSEVTYYDETALKVAAIEGKGNGVIATRFIKENELLFVEKPLFKNCHRTERYGEFCLWCCRSNISHNVHFNNVQSHLSTCLKCDVCTAIYCSEKCRQLSRDSGHQWLCGAYASGVVDRLNEKDPRGHILLALDVYAKIAQDMLTHPSVPAHSFVASVLEGVQVLDYCRITHAFRCGLKAVDEELFASLIAPAYFRSYLEEALELFESYFNSATIRVFWGDQEGEGGGGRCEEFLGSELFTENFFRHIIGAFASNCLEIKVLDDGENLSASLRGTGFFKLYSKLNHNCTPNTLNASAAAVQSMAVAAHAEVAVFAARDIAVGEEITTSYLDLQHGSRGLSNGVGTMTRKERQQKLRQYMFRCKCRMCEEEKGRDGEDSSDEEEEEAG